MAFTLSTSVSGPVMLNPSLNPLYITNTGTVTSTGAADGIDGAAGTTWTISNQGGLVTAAGGNGVALGGSGIIGNSGSISGTTAILTHGGSVTNNQGGTLSGAGTSGTGGAGVYISGASGSVINAGNINATGTGGAAVDLGAGGSLTNDSTGTLTGNGFGAFVTGAAGSVTNSGSITGADGVALAHGGSVANNAGGRITGINNGIYSGAGFAGAVTNSGSIASGTAGSGVDLGGGGSLTNNAGGSISGGAFGVFTNGGPGLVTNSGSISGVQGVHLAAGGTVFNNGASILGQTAGVQVFNAAGTIFNSGQISATGTGSAAADLESGGSVTNDAGATLSGAAFGVFITNGGGTVTNAGTIAGATYAVDFAGSGTNRLIVDSGAVFTSKVTANSVANNTMELASGTGSITGVGTGTFGNFQTLAVDPGGNWTLTGTNAVPNVLDSGNIVLSGPFTGLFQLQTGSTLEVAAAATTSTQIDFAGTSKLIVDTPSTFGTNVGTPSYTGPQLQNFVNGDQIDLKSFSSSNVTFNFNATTGLLQVSNGASQTASLAFQASSLGSTNFTATSDGGTGILITNGPGTNAGISDVFWRNSSDGTLAHWTLNGAQITSSQQVTLGGNPVAPDASWNVAGVGDFNGDGKGDLLWRNTNGSLIDWTMNGAQITSAQNVTLGGTPVAPDASWNVAGLGDFNGDGKSDILWRNNNGALIDWTMNGSQITASQNVTLGGSPVAPDSSWNVAGFGDFNGDGKSDVLWRNANGTLVDWTMNGAQIASSQDVTLGGNPAMPDASWSVAGIGDFNGDGKSDILWRNTNGTLIDWTMNGSQIASNQVVTLGGNAVSPDSSWQIAQIADFSGDGKSDILWRNANGALDEWTMNGAQIASSQTVTLQGNAAAPGSNWSTLAKPTDFV